jgi:hypothetical protein
MDTNTPATQAFSQSNPIQDNPGREGLSTPTGGSPSTPTGGSPSTPAGGSPSTPARPKGLNATAIVLGVVALVLAGLVIANETMDLNIDWSGKWPGAIVGVGVLFVVLGAIGLVRRHDDAQQ